MPENARLLALVALVTMGSASIALADDPPGSAGTVRTAAPAAPLPSVAPLPGRTPRDFTLGGLAEPPQVPGDPTANDLQAQRDQQIDALILRGPDEDGLGLAAASTGDDAASSANCWANGVGCGPGGQPQFEANCHSQGGGLSSEEDPEHGPYVQCTLPPH